MCGGHNCSESRALVDGEDAFETVLAFLDENHDAISSMIQSTAEQVFFGALSGEGVGCNSETSPRKPSPTQAPQPNTRRGSPLHSGKRRRQELIALREEAAVLEERLKRLKGELASDVCSASAFGLLHIQAWQAITQAQQQRREAAEKERERLCELVREQMAAAQEIYRYVCSQASSEDSAASMLDTVDDNLPPA